MIQEEATLTNKTLDNSMTLVDSLCWKGQHRPDSRAYIFLSDGEQQEESLTYAELDQRARAIGRTLQLMHADGERVLLLYPAGLDYIAAFLGCLYAGAIAVPAYPPHSNRSLTRIQSIVDDSQATIALTTAQMLTKTPRWFEHVPDLAALQWVASDEIANSEGQGWQRPALTGDTLALLQYTSGSTSAPKGVMVSHGNIMHNLAAIQDFFHHTPESVGVSWLPMFHDMGLIACILHALHEGFPLVLLSPTAFLQRPLRWLQAISRYGGTFSCAPNFAYELCISRITPEERAELDLSTWEVVVTGAEPVRGETLARFAETFQACGFRWEAFSPSYGLAEGTLGVASTAHNSPLVKFFDGSELKEHRVVELPEHAPHAQPLVGNGTVALGQTIVIANPETMTKCPEGEVGEIWLAGGSVAQGYWNNDAETEQTFRAFLADSGDGPFLRTGDMGFLLDENLFITGRLKDLIIIRGQNHYPQDIELTVAQCHPALRPDCGAAFSIEVAEEGFGILSGQEERLVIVHEVLRHHDEFEDIFAAIRQAVVDTHEIEVYAIVLVKYGSILKTSSGKIQRRACREKFLVGELEELASSILSVSLAPPATPQPDRRLSRDLLRAISREEAYELLEGYFLGNISQMIGCDQEELSAEQLLSSFGLDSLKMAQIKNRIEVDLEIDLPVSSFFQDTELSTLILEALELIRDEEPFQTGPRLVRIDTATTDAPLSFTQEQLWFFDQLEPGSPLYTIPVALLLRGELDVAALEHSINEIIRRHDVLRATFLRVDGVPVQRVQPFAPRSLPIIDLTNLNEIERERTARQRAIHEILRPFDLSTGPLLRVTLLRLEAQEHLLLLNIHHIISDEWSLNVFFRELSLLYAGDAAELPDLPVRYSDYARWQRQLQYTEEMEEQLAYWREQLQGLERLELPLDHERPAVQAYMGEQYAFTFSQALSAKIKVLSQQEGATMFMTLLASFQVLLARYSGQEDIVVGTPIAQRGKAELEDMIGYFANMLVLRTNLSGSPSFRELLARVREMCVDAYTHQDLPFVKLVEALHPVRDASRNPLFQVFFALITDPVKYISLPGLVVQPLEIPTATAKFDLNFSVSESAQGLVGRVEYNRHLFERATIADMVAHWEKLLDGIAADPEQTIFELPLLNDAEYQQILQAGNATAHSYAMERCLHELFEAQAQQTPDALAITFEDQQLTYGELDQRANQLAHHLSKLTVQPGTPIGLCLERSLDMAVGMLAILKCGGIYTPLEPGQPQRRLAFIVEDTRLSVVVTHSSLLAQFPEDMCDVHFICLDITADVLEHESTAALAGKVSSDFPAYIIYTSGSTGTPKGVINTHRALHNRLAWMLDAIPFSAADRVAQKTPYSFDASLWEFLVPWMLGARVVMAEPGGHQNSAYLCSFINEEAITILQLVPSMLHVLLQERDFATCHTLQHVFCGGEALPTETQRRFYSLSQASLYNLYGPTESSIDATYWPCQPEWDDRVPIGRPLSNVEIYLLDAQMQPVPRGCIGELYIGGASLALGYLNRPDLTAERFLPHPLSQEPGRRLYRTGDKARQRADGLIEYLGRTDQQVKVRGYRIELGEIEAVLNQHAAVKQSVVIVRNDPQGEPRLVAYVLTHEGEEWRPNELRNHLLEHLPFYMLPAHLIPLAELPRLSNGKIDYQALPEPQEALQAQAVDENEPYSPAERMVCEICAQYLHLPQVSKHANFFELGGHSLLATQVINRIRELYHIEVPLRLLFTTSTIADFARLLETIWSVGKKATSAEGSREEGVL
jgi:amino acid adenylation domain-containing protein